jgi:hypothetical protein
MSPDAGQNPVQLRCLTILPALLGLAWPTLGLGVVARGGAAAPAAAAGCDPFGVRKLFPTQPGGREWFARWSNGHPREFANAIDPDDPWFDTDHGDGRYVVDGRGKLTATGDHVRMYVHDPRKQAEWGENLEITVYIRRIGETKLLSYSGLQIFARTNHGTTGPELQDLCDDRGYGAKVLVDGCWEFEKETAHHLDKGYTSVATARPWLALPKNTLVGVKYVIRNVHGGTHVKVELYRDLAGGLGGGTWQKITEFIDTGANWGVGAGACRPGVKPELPLMRPLVLCDSESGKPIMTVYFRHEFGTIEYQWASIREIAPLP